MHFERSILGLMTVCIILSGCATSGARISSIPSSLERQSALTTTVGGNSYIVSIRWPVGVSERARGQFIDTYRRFDRMVYAAGAKDESALEVGPEMTFTSSTYFAAEMAEALRRSMPKAQIIMQPTVIDLDETGSLKEVPQGAEEIPATLIVSIADENGGEFPFMGTMLSYTVRTAPDQLKSNCGLLLAMEEEINNTISQNMTSGCSESQAAKAPNPIWYLGFDEKGGRRNSFKISDSLPLNENTVVVFPPIQLFSMNLFQANTPDYVKNSRPYNTVDVKKMQLHPHILNLANIVSSAPDVLSEQGQKYSSIEEYVKIYDQDLASAVIRGASLTQPQRNNIELIKKLLAAEVKIRSKRDEQLSAWILAGSFGKSYRSQRDKSYEGFNSMMASSWASAATLTAATPAASSSIGMLSRNMTMLKQHASSMDQAGQGIYESFIPSLDAMENEYIDFDGRQISLRKGDEAALRDKLLALYKKHQE